MPDNSQSLTAAVTDLAASNLILVRFIAAGMPVREVNVPEGATLSDALAAANMSVSDKSQYTQSSAALSADTPVRASTVAGAVVISAAGANG